MSESTQSKPVKTTHRIRNFILHVALLLVAFLAGFVWMGLKYRECSGSLSKAQSQYSGSLSEVQTQRLNLAIIQNSLGSAAIDARRGDYETARLAASDFFTWLRAETSKGVDSALSQAQKDGAQPLFARRDEIITLLARGDVTSADMLSDLYVAYRKLVNP
jgi:hypothetical protein